MTEQIKSALAKWAENVLQNQSDWGDEETHAAIQRLYEISTFHKLLKEDTQQTKKWSHHQNELKEVLETFNTFKEKDESPAQDEHLEVPPLMDAIKNMVTEMPETEPYKSLFENVSETPSFIAKKEENTSETVLEHIEEEKKNINDLFAKTLSIDLNDRLAFVKHLFEEDVNAYERVLSQIVTYESWEEVEVFINEMVKPEYQNWKDKEPIEARFLTILQKNFSV